MYTIRRAEEKDTQVVLRLLAQVNGVHHAGRPDLFKGPATKYNAPELREIFADDKRPVFVLEEAGQVLGYAFCIFQQYADSLLMTDIKTLYIDDLCVEEAARGRQVGTALYRHVLDFARAAGCYNVTLNVWALNEPARRFYEKCGMQVQKIGMEQIL